MGRSQIYVYLLIYSFLTSFFVVAQDKVPIILGVSNALSGPAKQLGTRLNLGARLYFQELNAKGGIRDRSVHMMSLDDGYEPYRSVKNTYQLLKHPDVFALFNYVGTPTSHAVLPIVEEYGGLYVMPFTGAEFLRDSNKDYIINLRASYYQEAQAQIDYLFDELNVKSIGLLIQSDEFGKAVEQGYLQALAKRGLAPTVITRFRRNTKSVALALELLKQNKVDAVGFVGTYKPLAELINLGYQRNFKPIYTTVSFVSSHDLFAGINYPSRVIVTQVVPEPVTCKLPICLRFMALAKKNKVVDTDPIVFEGFLNAIVFSEVAKHCRVLTTSCFKTQYRQFNANLGGLTVSYDAKSHQGFNSVYLSIYDTRH